MKIKWSFLSGAGNTFLISDSSELADKQLSSMAQRYCQQTEGLQADGLIWLERFEPQADLKWHFFNSDGSSAEMCGNAARCVAIYAKEKMNIKKQKLHFLTLAGSVYAEVLGENKVCVSMPAIKDLQEGKTVQLSGEQLQGFYIDSGVPHFVLELSKEPKIKEKVEQARALRGHKDFLPKGSNITYFWKKQSHLIGSMTFERGVEAFTQACGTGAVAAAKAACLADKEQKSYLVDVPGGQLKVDFKKNEHPELTGPAKIVFDIEFYK